MPVTLAAIDRKVQFEAIYVVSGAFSKLTMWNSNVPKCCTFYSFNFFDIYKLYHTL